MFINYERIKASTSNFKQFHNNLESLYIFNNILCNDSNIVNMIHAASLNFPPIIVVISEIEAYTDSIHSPTFDIKNNDFCRSYIGRLISLILGEFGFTPTTTTRIPERINSKYFASASKFSLTKTPNFKVNYKIVAI